MIPILQMLKAYCSSNPLPFHMPGHVLGRGMADELKNAGRLDITEIPGADCLHAPHGVIEEAQKLAAKSFGSECSFFLVNGSTAGLHAMIQATAGPGDKLIVGRDCHRSVVNALALINAHPVFVKNRIDEKNNIPLGIDKESIKKAVKKHPEAKGILVTRPNYYGIAPDLKEISQLSSENGLPLLVDEAHGAHFCFHSAFPVPSLKMGADLCVQSLHKTLPALTQTALLHRAENSLIKRKAIETTVSMVQTTSPSYLLLASIDIARNLMENEGRELYQSLLALLDEFDYKIRELNIRRTARKYEGCDTDPTRVVLSFENTSLTGFEAEKILRTRYGIVAEMADFKHIVLIATPFHTHEDFERLIKGLKEISENHKPDSGTIRKIPKWPGSMPEYAATIREALFGPSKDIPINKAMGEISAVSVVPYPPGIPLVNPGERLNREFIDYILSLLRMGCPVHGISGDRINVLAGQK